MNYQELEDLAQSNSDRLDAVEQAQQDSIGGLSFPLDPYAAQMLDDETQSFLSNRAGTATLVAGTVVVSNVNVGASSIILLSRNVAGGTLGNLSISAQSAGSFTILSSSATETSTVNYLII